MKVRPLYTEDEIVSFICPGCSFYHNLPTKGPHAWGFNKNFDAPTLTPSILATEEGVVDESGNVLMKPRICHSFVTDGKIQFLHDCTHNYAGKTLDLPDIK